MAANTNDEPAFRDIRKAASNIHAAVAQLNELIAAGNALGIQVQLETETMGFQAMGENTVHLQIVRCRLHVDL